VSSKQTTVSSSPDRVVMAVVVASMLSTGASHEGMGAVLAYAALLMSYAGCHASRYAGCHASRYAGGCRVTPLG
jgi:hypothetical protein